MLTILISWTTQTRKRFQEILLCPADAVFRCACQAAGAFDTDCRRTTIIVPTEGTTMPVKKSKAKRDATGNAGSVTKEPDAKPRIITTPEDLKTALARLPTLDFLFSSLPYSHKKEYVDWITEARRPETREARIRKALKMLAAKQPPKR
jgi:hypothetical protein